MLDSDAYRERGNSKSYNTNSGHTTTENGSAEDKRAGISLKNFDEEVTEVHKFTQGEAN